MTHLSIFENRISSGLQHFFIFVSFLFLFVNMAGASEKNEKALYEKELFAPQEISNSVIGSVMDPEVFRSLTAAQKRDLLEAKKTLVSFIKAAQVPDADLSRFLGSGLLVKYKSRDESLNKFLGQKRSIRLAVVTLFELVQDGALNLRYFVVPRDITHSEGGTLVLDEDSAKLKKQGSYWKIMSIGGLGENGEVVKNPPYRSGT